MRIFGCGEAVSCAYKALRLVLDHKARGNFVTKSYSNKLLRDRRSFKTISSSLFLSRLTLVCYSSCVFVFAFLAFVCFSNFVVFFLVFSATCESL